VIGHVNVDKRWYKLSTEETLSELNSIRSGLTTEEAKTRLLEYGPNELPAKKKSPPFIAFLRQFLSPLIYVLLIAALISVALEHYVDAGVIMAVLLLNAVIGYIQETRAEKAMDALMQMVKPNAKIKRDGAIRLIPARDIVPGDIIILETGDKVPADARLIEASNLKIDEAILTGESVAIGKHNKTLDEEVSLAERKNMVHMGTIVSYGRATAVTIATGPNSEIGNIARTIQELPTTKTPLQKSIGKLSKYLVILFLVFCSLLVIIGLVQGLDWLEIFIVAVAAAVAVIPEGLPAVVTVALALGMRTMARRNAIVRRLVAVETLGSATVICTDKTGTLTRNEMTVRKIVVDNKTIELSGKGYEPIGEFRRDGVILKPEYESSLDLLLNIGTICNDALLSTDEKSSSILGDPTEGALVVAAAKAGISKESIAKTFPRLDEIPFQSEKQYMATLHSQDGRRVAYVKGAPERILHMSKRYIMNGQIVPLLDTDAQHIQESSAAMAGEAMRVLAIAYAEITSDTVDLKESDLRDNLIFVGLVGMEDPPRAEAIKAVALCKQAGIKVVMVTGDNIVTAESIGRRIGLSQGSSVTGAQIVEMSDEALHNQIEDISVFARVEPLQKLRIVNAFKSLGHIVAMTGDGVNDAPALKATDIGIAMGIKGTDVAKEASDVVLADDNFASIVAAVDEGRSVFNKLRNVIFFDLSTNIGELLAFLLALIFVGQSPLLAVQILWVNLVTDSAMGLPLVVEPKIGDELKQPPRHPKVGLLFPGLLFRVVFLAAMMGVGVFAIFKWSYGRVSIEEARTMAFCTLVAFEWLRAFNARSDEYTIFKLGIFRNRYMVLAVGLAVLLQMAVVYIPFMQTAFHTVPLSPEQWGIIFGIAGSIFITEELRKVIAPKLFSRGKWNPA
jgi:Ca2+-transporting ATPase